MGIVGGFLILGCVVMVLFGPDEGNAKPALYAGVLGIVFIIAALVAAAI